jgi:hypothetical protein
MAKAVKKAVVPAYTVTLELSDQEALVVHALCGIVSGDSASTNRKHSSAVYHALAAAGVDSHPARATLGLDYGKLEFTK